VQENGLISVITLRGNFLRLKIELRCALGPLRQPKFRFKFWMKRGLRAGGRDHHIAKRIRSTAVRQALESSRPKWAKANGHSLGKRLYLLNSPSTSSCVVLNVPKSLSVRRYWPPCSFSFYYHCGLSNCCSRKLYMDPSKTWRQHCQLRRALSSSRLRQRRN
jgi:hypothetical protein